jgi:multidrug efflux system membrane fusion protein
MNMKKSSKLIIACIFLALIGTTYWYWNGSRIESAPPSKAPPNVPVTVSTAKTGEMPILLKAVGRAEAYESVTLKSRLDGQVLSVAYVEGHAVKQGDVLLKLDPADFNAKLAQAEAIVAKDQAQLAKAHTDVERYNGLKARGFVSEEKVNEVRTNETAAAATMKADQAALELARLQLSYTTIRAPFSGVIGARLVFPGSSVKINDTALAVLNRVSPLYISFAVPERQLQLLRQSMKQSPLIVTVTEPGSKTAIFEGKAKFIDNAVDPATGTILIKAVLENSDGRLTPGQFLNVSMELGRVPDTVLVPNEAVQQGAEGNFLYVVKSDSTVEARKIVVIGSYQGLSAITKGLVAEEVVVTDGQLRLAPGARITSKSEKSEEVNKTASSPTTSPR